MILVLSIILNWLLIGYFICVKRNWYGDYQDKQFLVMGNLFLSPIALVIAFVRVFIIHKWENEK
jgi:hypothetical protein